MCPIAAYGTGGADTYGTGGADTYGTGGADTYGTGGADTYSRGGADTYGTGGADTYGTGGADTSVLLSLPFVQHFILILNLDNLGYYKIRVCLIRTLSRP
jgi:hypothetical protein